MRIAVDAMGGDHAPDEIVKGACAAARDFGVQVVLVGDERAIKACLPQGLPSGISIEHATQQVEMGESPTQAYRKKTDSSLAVATRLHAEGRADAVLSAGNTGAAALHALFILKRIKGIDRPGIANVYPTSQDPVVTIDVGANVDCRPRHLAEFAIMGAAYARTVHGIIPGTGGCLAHGELPRVGLLSIGEEESKGNELTKAAFGLIRDNAQVGQYIFHGNVEGRDLAAGTVEVIVCDGFVGNVVLKVAEGLAKMFAGELKTALLSSPRAKLGAMLLRPALQKFKARFDYTDYGGALLLGVMAFALFATVVPSRNLFIRRFVLPDKLCRLTWWKRFVPQLSKRLLRTIPMKKLRLSPDV
jgi:glycerol-3-phosphate acyltransferase PlsX